MQWFQKTQFFDFSFGKLPYRSLRFEHFKAKRDEKFSFKLGSVINECNDKPYNRTSDNSVFLNEKGSEETIYTRDYPEEHDDSNDPIYPKNFGEGLDIYKQYKKAIDAENNVLFLGRLASYKYLDMWMAIKQVMTKLRWSELRNYLCWFWLFRDGIFRHMIIDPVSVKLIKITPVLAHKIAMI